MLLNKYQANELLANIQLLLKQKSSGILNIKTTVSSWTHQRNCSFVFNNGYLTFAGNTVPSNHQLCKTFISRIESNMLDSALSVANQRIKNSNSVRELFELLVQMKVFGWKELETWLAAKVVLTLEKFLDYPVESQWQSETEFDLLFGEDHHGLNWSSIQQKLNQRQPKWHTLYPIIPSMDAIPLVSPQHLEKINDPLVKEHLAIAVDGKRNLFDVAERLGKDPLKVAQTYFKWYNNGWVDFKIQLIEWKNLPIVLSVDDSPIVQTAIKRALQKDYKVLLSNNTDTAIKLLSQYQVELLLLDLTLPDTDGLTFCQQIRSQPKFKDLPILMLTARNGLANRARGHFAGADRYLTKPFEPEELKKIVSEYVGSAKSIEPEMSPAWSA